MLAGFLAILWQEAHGMLEAFRQHRSQAAGLRHRPLVPYRVCTTNGCKRYTMAWIYLIIAGLFEVAWAVGLKYTDGFTRGLPTLLTVAAMVVSFFFLAQAVKMLPVGTAYAIWTGIGAVGTAVMGIVLFSESADPGRIVSIMLIVAGIVGLKLASP